MKTITYHGVYHGGLFEFTFKMTDERSILEFTKLCATNDMTITITRITAAE